MYGHDRDKAELAFLSFLSVMLDGEYSAMDCEVKIYISILLDCRRPFIAPT